MYRGRFAPSPSGPLHMGSLLVAIAGFLQARSQAGRWLLRIDNADSGRCQPNAAAAITDCLQRHQLKWDETLLQQSQHFNRYQQLCDHLLANQQAYWCGCSRKDLQRQTDGRLRYPGHCRTGLHGKTARAVRLRATATDIHFHDPTFGPQQENPLQRHGDFIIRRADGVWAYQLTVVADDHYSQVTEVVRGADLMDSTARQLQLYQQLAWAAPNHLHLPLLVDSNGRKLSKSEQSPAVTNNRPETNWLQILGWLGQQPPPSLQQQPLPEIIQWAIAHWRPQAIRGDTICIQQ